MLTYVISCAVIGLDGIVVDVEVNTRSDLPGVVIGSRVGKNQNLSFAHLQVLFGDYESLMIINSHLLGKIFGNVSSFDID